MKSTLTPEQVNALYDERTRLDSIVNPPPPPQGEWPPRGWSYYPGAPQYLYRVVREDKLREEFFGSEAKDNWMAQATKRIAEIDKMLIPYFFPDLKEEGTQRKTMDGFSALTECTLERKVDQEALPAVMKKLPKGTEATVIKWTAALIKKGYNALGEVERETMDNAIATKAGKRSFQIVRLPQ